MPTRLVREGINSSDRVASLGWAAEVFYRRVMLVVDDFGRFDGRPTLLRAACYPTLVDSVSDSDVEGWLWLCVDAELIQLYSVNGKNFIQLHDFGEPRAKKSKWPAPDDKGAENVCKQMQTDANKCLQMKTDANECAHAQADESKCKQTQTSAPYSYSYSYSSSDSSSDANTPLPPTGGGGYRVDFAEWYDAYPRKVGKDAAAKSYEAAQKRLQAQRIQDRQQVSGYLLERAKAYAKSPAGNRGQYTPHPSVWLNQGRYLDDDSEWNRGDGDRRVIAAGDGQVTAEDSVGW